MICKTFNHEIRSELELIFEYGVEDGASLVFRNKEEQIISSGSSGGWLD